MKSSTQKKQQTYILLNRKKCLHSCDEKKRQENNVQENNVQENNVQENNVVIYNPPCYDNIGGINNNSNAPGRFANHFIRNLACSIIASKSNIKFTYGEYQNYIEALGVKLFHIEQNSCKRLLENVELNDTNFFQYIHTPIEKNFSLKNSYCQTRDFSLYLYDYFRENTRKENIIQSNIFKNRYKNNNDVFIHVRLGDVTEKQMRIYDKEYFDNILSKLNFNKGFISSDSMDHNMCKYLIEKYNLIPFFNNEVKTIMFASTCKHLILTGGTFGWTMGILAFDSDVYYKKYESVWYPHEIFDIPSWKGQ